MKENDLPKGQVNNVDELLHTINGLIEMANGELVAMGEESPVPQPAVEMDLESLREKGLFEAQIQEIELGVKQKLPVEVYAKECYNWRQMSEIRLGLIAKLDVDAYANPLFTAEQMREIRLGLEEEVDVSGFAKLIYSASDMHRKRRELLTENYKLHMGSKEHVIKDEETKVELRISEDDMEAYMKIPSSSKRKYTLSELKKLLKRYEVIFGVLEDGIRRLVVERVRDKEVKVAQGTKPLTGKDGWYKLFFKGNLPGIPKVLPDGRVDYSNVMVADTVMPKQLLAQYQPAKPGKEGMTVTGIPVEGCKGKELAPLKGQGIIADEEKGTYTAEIKGCVSYDATAGTLNVWQVYTMEGDINRYSGSVVFDGSVHIRGTVTDMAVIRATGDVTVDGFVGGAVIQAGNNVVLKGGVNAAGRGSIEAGGKIMGDFFEMVTLKAREGIEGNYFLNCNIETDAKVIAKGSKARILGGNIVAAAAVESAVIMNAGNVRTYITVGDLFSLEKRASSIEAQMQKALEEKEKLTEGKEKLLKLYGDEAVEGNKIYQKACIAIEMKDEERETLEKEAAHIKRVKGQAIKACVRVARELYPNVMLSINGTKMETREMLLGVTLNKEKLESMLKPKK